jgi:hypothetical protein
VGWLLCRYTSFDGVDGACYCVDRSVVVSSVAAIASLDDFLFSTLGMGIALVHRLWSRLVETLYCEIRFNTNLLDTKAVL